MRQWTLPGRTTATIIAWSSDLTVSANSQNEALAPNATNIYGQSTLVLEENDVLKIQANVADRIHVTAAVLQVDNFKRFREAGTTA